MIPRSFEGRGASRHGLILGFDAYVTDAPDQVIAANRFHASLLEDRARLQSLARREFRRD